MAGRISGSLRGPGRLTPRVPLLSPVEASAEPRVPLIRHPAPRHCLPQPRRPSPCSTARPGDPLPARTEPHAGCGVAGEPGVKRALCRASPDAGDRPRAAHYLIHFLSADGLFSREHPGPHAGPSLASVSLSITFNSLTVTVYNVSILQNRSVNSGLAEQRLRKINNSNARDDSAAAPFPPGFVVSSCSAKGGTAERVGAAGAKGRIPSHAADPGRPAGPAPPSQTKAIPEPLGPDTRPQRKAGLPALRPAHPCPRTVRPKVPSSSFLEQEPSGAGSPWVPRERPGSRGSGAHERAGRQGNAAD